MSKKAPKTRTVYEGPLGMCPCCQRVTEIRLAGTLGADNTPWVVALPVLEAIYSSVAARIKEKDGELYVTDPSDYDAAHRSKLFFVDAGDSVAGPFGPTGLKVFLRSQFGESPSNVTVYVVRTTHRALSVIRQSPFAVLREAVFDLEAAIDLF